MTESKADKSKVDLGLLEEDDEFEEFPAEGLFSRLYFLKTCIFTKEFRIVLHCNLKTVNSSQIGPQKTRITKTSVSGTIIGTTTTSRMTSTNS